MTDTRPTTPLLPADQRALLRALNERSAPTPEGTVPDLIAVSAARHGDRPALIAPGLTLTHAELADRVTAAAAQVAETGVAPGDRVALCAEYGWEQLVGALAVLHAGGVCLPVPPDWPRVQRWQRIARAKAAAVLTQSWLTDRIEWPRHTPLVPLDVGPPGSARPQGAPVPRAVADPAYQLETATAHGALVTAATEVNRQFGVGPGDRLLALAGADSPLALYELFGPLLAGAAVVLTEDIDLRSPRALLADLRRHQVTVWNSPPALLDLLLDHLAEDGGQLPETLRLLLLSGERLAPAQVHRLRAAAPHRPALAHLTSPTASSPWALCMEVGDLEPDRKTVPAGVPLPNQRVHILSEATRLCPVWVTGRLHFGGTAAQAPGGEPPDGSLVEHPETGEPLLRSGLFARLLPEGVVEVVGDEAAQIVVHGRPLNLQDTETALAAHEAVHTCVVVPGGREGDSLARVRLLPGARVSTDVLLAYLRRSVSPYLLPGRLEIVERLPLTRDGRVDRAALTADATSTASAAPPAELPDVPDDSELLEQVSRVTCRVLGLSDVEPHMNLLDTGASSIELVRLTTVLEEELGIATDIEELLRFPSVAVIVSKHLGTQDTQDIQDTPAPRQQASPEPSEPSISGIGARQAFKDARHGIRHEYGEAEGVELAGPAVRRILARRSYRSFAQRPVARAALAELIGALREVRQEGEPKFWYPSAGSAYPVQTYLLAHPGRVSGLPGGSYYHHPVSNRLVSIEPAAVLPASAHAETNRSVYEEAAFSLYLVSDTEAIAPLYGELAWDFSVFEAGAMTQLLMQVAPEVGLGLCPAGSMDPAPLRRLFALGEDHRFVHALFGGHVGEERS